MLQMCCLFHNTKYDKTDPSTNAADVLFIFTIQSMIKQINQPMLQMCCLFSQYKV